MQELLEKNIGFHQGLKNRFFRSIYRRKSGFQAASKKFALEKIRNKKIGEKSEKNSRFLAKKSGKSDFFGGCATRAWERVGGR